MPPRPSLIRPSHIHLSLPEDIRGKLDLMLWSGVDGRVPKGAYQRFFLDRIQEFFGWRRVDLSLYGFPQGFFVAGPKEMLENLEHVLKERQNGGCTNP
jgi:hypothetical protein